jgi:hypothetical protein
MRLTHNMNDFKSADDGGVVHGKSFLVIHSNEVTKSDLS